MLVFSVNRKEVQVRHEKDITRNFIITKYEHVFFGYDNAANYGGRVLPPDEQRIDSSETFWLILGVLRPSYSKWTSCFFSSSRQAL